jgi:glycosyltransferase involved in cell wall biosynthesis
LPLTIAIIMPVLNEAAYIASTLTHIQQLSGWQSCVVVDGGSQDGTCDIAQQHPLHPHVLSISGGRAAQLNAALAHVSSDVVVLIGADCRLSRATFSAIRRAISHGAVAGCLRLRNATRHPLFRWQDHWARLRSHWTTGAYIDQAPFFVCHFARRLGFRDLGSYDTADLGRRLNKHRSITIVPATVVASCRHWRQFGFFGGTWKHQRQRLRHWFQYL